MRDGESSLTARAVAMARAMATTVPGAVVNPGDDAVLGLLPPSTRTVCDLLSVAGRLSPWIPRAAFGLSLGVVDHLALRSVAIDAIVHDFVRQHDAQVVILGAGLDMRGYRMPALSKTDVFEVDHPVTQASKLAAVGHREPSCRKLHHIAVDFDRDDLDAELAEGGHDRNRPTLFIWEGVVAYLGLRAIEQTLATIGRRSAVGSELAMTYIPSNQSILLRTRRVADVLMRLVGEPLGIQPSQQQVDAMLDAAGLSPVSDTDTHDWRERHSSGEQLAMIIAYERLAHARKTG